MPVTIALKSVMSSWSSWRSPACCWLPSDRSRSISSSLSVRLSSFGFWWTDWGIHRRSLYWCGAEFMWDKKNFVWRFSSPGATSEKTGLRIGYLDPLGLVSLPFGYHWSCIYWYPNLSLWSQSRILFWVPPVLQIKLSLYRSQHMIDWSKMSLPESSIVKQLDLSILLMQQMLSGFDNSQPLSIISKFNLLWIDFSWISWFSSR